MFMMWPSNIPSNIKVRYELSDKEIENVNKEYHLGVGFDESIKR